MDQNNVNRCPHFQIYSEPLEMEGPPAYLAIRRCLLTERMIRLLELAPEGSPLAEKLVIHATNGRTFAFVGPDLESVTHNGCTVQRCNEHCTPGYRHHLNHFGIVDPNEETVTCEDDDPDDKSGRDDPDIESCPCPKG